MNRTVPVTHTVSVKPPIRTKRAVRGVLAATAALSMVTLSACGSPAGTPTDLGDAATALGSADVASQMDALYKAAQDGGETSVVIYGPGEQLYGAAYQTFMARYPDIQVTGEYIYGAELVTRLDQEYSSGQHVGSIQTGGPAITSATVAAGRCSTYAPFAADYMDGGYPVAEDGTHRAVVGFPFGIAYNTEKVSESEIPQTFTDLSDPAYKGQFVLEDPTTVNGTANSMARMYAAGLVDESWLTDVAANEPMLRANSALTVQAVASGEASFDPFAQFVQYKQPIADGLPVGFYFPLDKSLIEYHYSCVLEDAPNANATQLLYNWLFTPEGQTALSTTGVYGVRPGTPAPEGLPPFEDATADLAPSVPVMETNAATKAFIEVSKPIFQ